MTLPSPTLMLVTYPYWILGLLDIIKAAVDGGTNVVQWRDRARYSSEIENLDDKLNSILHDRAILIANGQRLWNAGLHLPENYHTGPKTAEREKTDFHAPLVGRSIHSVERAVWAAEDGADYLVAGTIYPSNSHPGEPGQGVGFLREVCAAVAPLPVIAIGGITPERVGECIAAGAAGVAVLSPIMGARDPQAVARTYREALDTAWKQRNE